MHGITWMLIPWPMLCCRTYLGSVDDSDRGTVDYGHRASVPEGSVLDASAGVALSKAEREAKGSGQFA
jgi:hypothetical protein